MKILMLNHSRPNPLSHDCHIHEDESLLNSLRRNVRARQSTSSFHPVPSSEAALAFSADSLEPACLSNKQWKKVGVEVSYPVTADMFENPEDDWLATASSRARARVEVNIKKLSAEECAQFRAAQHKEMDQWISNDVISSEAFPNNEP